MDVTKIPMWTVTVTYRDGTAKVFLVQDLDDFHVIVAQNVYNTNGASMLSVLMFMQ